MNPTLRREARGGLLGYESMTVTFLRLSAPKISAMHRAACNEIDPSYMVRGRLFSTLFHIIPPRPDLFLSAWPEFLETGEFSQQIFLEFAPQKIVSIFHKITIPPRACRHVPWKRMPAMPLGTV